ncbi:MAG: hypothetical protein PWQ20_1027 [Thermotogaceae bacterium]|nr:hypothetical protein [Thermotogaceae bacterium]MDN5337957.1 hypothetical protein [Thermotogaceae bacterium]
MRRVILFFLTILFLNVCMFSAEEKTISVLYQIEIVELSDEKLSSLGLLDSAFSNSPDNNFGVYYLNESQSLLLDLSYSQIILDSEKNSTRESKSSRFWLVTNFNEPAHLSTEQENIDLESGESYTTGIDISVKPIKISDGLVLTELNVLSLPNYTLLNNTVWLNTSEFLPLAIVTFRSGYKNSSSWYLESKTKTRYFALYAKCSLIEELPKEDIYLIGSVDGFSKMFWQIPEYPKENYLKVYLGSNSTGFVPSLDISFWPKDNLKLKALLQLAVFPDILGEVEIRPFKDDFRFSSRVLYVQSTKTTSLLLGFTDHVYFRFFTLSAGYYPISLNLKSLSFEKAMWWFSANTVIDGSKLEIGCESKNNYIDLFTEANLKISNNFYMLGRVDYNINNLRFLLSMGIRIDY